MMACLVPPPPAIADGFSPSPLKLVQQNRLVSAFQSPKSLSELRALHGRMITTGLRRNDLVLGKFIICCSSSNCMEYARKVFDEMSSPSVFFWNAMIKGYQQNGDHMEVLRLYFQMRSCGFDSDAFTFPVVLRSCSPLKRIREGKGIHGLVLKTGYATNVIVQTALMDLYSLSGCVASARQVFDEMRERDVICWNTMIAGYSRCGDFANAEELFHKMPEKDESSWNTLIDMYCKAGDVEAARRLFDEMPKKDIISWNAMISGYVHIGDMEVARLLFDEMPRRSVVSWNVVITCCVHHRRFTDALDLFRKMQRSDVRPNEVTMVAVLPACAHLGAMDLGQWIHAYIDKNRIRMDVYVTTALIDMYGKCGNVEEARRVFEMAKEKDAFSYSTMIEVLALNGKAEEAFQIFSYMQSHGLKPNGVTFVGLLTACSHAGLVEKGRMYFNMMKSEYNLEPKSEHFGCMVDLLGRAGYLDEAFELIKSMPMEPHVVVWGALLNACRIHGNVKLAETVGFRLIELNPTNCGNYVLLANIYAKANRWDDSVRVRKMMKDRGVVKKPGCSSIEVNNSVHEFIAGDNSHTHCARIYRTLQEVTERLKREGYVPEVSSALHDVDTNEKMQALSYHSEKLAVAFGLLSTTPGTPIRIVKNLRVCEDCHVMMKMISQHYDRNIILRDCNRYHHFNNGSCSCSDYW
ncbi:pentatricopeptide repeat-containing protein At3g62890-like [Nymphaea colorata]|nr:pentatricopeptide repeat-containing protein At3g62890-like [Nymphaea colorata]